MKYLVQGKLEEIGPLKDKLSDLGYKIEGNAFEKYAKIESVINELVPYLETRGIDVFNELYLQEYNSNGIIMAKYDKGRVIRKDLS